MEPSNVLIALEEWEKWRSRKTKLESRLEKLHREREALRAEHEAVKRELAVMREAMLEPIASRRDVQEFPPHGLGRGMVDAHAIWTDYRGWMQRKRDLERAMKQLDREEAQMMEELDRVEEQVAYYGSLAREMKKTLEPPKLAQLLRSLRRA